jgi:S-layer protein
VVTTSLYILSGMVAGDQVVLPVANDTIALATNLAGVNGEAVFAHGTYNASAGTFTYGATGSDTLLTFDAVNASSTHALESIVLVGFVATAASTMSYNGAIVLG